jgi:hypothetical protein
MMIVTLDPRSEHQVTLTTGTLAFALKTKR